jgi:O-succinylbenzoate synthase
MVLGDERFEPAVADRRLAFNIRCTRAHGCARRGALMWNNEPKMAVKATASTVAGVAPPVPLRLDAIELRLARLPLLEPFEVSFGRMESRLLFLLRLEAGERFGWGECVAWETPLYSYETVGTARHVIRDYLAPAILGKEIVDLADLASRLSAFRGHPMAKAGIELAFVDLVARLRGEPVARLIGGVRRKVEVGVSLGIQPTVDALDERVRRFLELGYRRIKLKIKPGADVPVVREIRRRHPQIPLSVDANAAYTLADAALLRQLDAYDLLMIEQPLAHDDLVDHAALQRTLATPICLDESITSHERARQALETGACRIINMKVGRVGGYSEALRIHDLCVERTVPLWCGGMFESGIGRAHNVALASLPGFSLPGDISGSRRYFERDVIVPPVEVAEDGTVAVPTSPGLGFEVDDAFLESRTESVDRLRA